MDRIYPLFHSISKLLGNTKNNRWISPNVATGSTLRPQTDRRAVYSLWF